MSKGWSNFSFGNARTTSKGGGGSGEPVTREVVKGLRTDFVGSASPAVGGPAEDDPSRAMNPAAIRSGHPSPIRDRRYPPGQGDGMNSAPGAATRMRFLRYGTSRAAI